MHAIIRQGNGKFYTSAVFGIYKGQHNGYDSDVFIVYNEAKDRLIAVPHTQITKNNTIQSIVLVFETSNIGWKYERAQRHFGGVGFLSKERAFKLVEAGKMPAHGDTVTTECEIEDKAVKLEKWYYVRNQHDIDNLLEVSGSFHDAYVAECQRDKKSGAIRVLFKDAWGVNIEMYFENEAECHLHDPEEEEPWWFDCTLLIHEGKIYLFDSENASPDSFDKWSTDCFRAKNARYHIIPR